jgi:hypothetical protein
MSFVSLIKNSVLDFSEALPYGGAFLCSKAQNTEGATF